MENIYIYKYTLVKCLKYFTSSTAMAVWLQQKVNTLTAEKPDLLVLHVWLLPPLASPLASHSFEAFFYCR